jgi:hypothetical protein
VRSPISVWRSRARERHWRTCSGGIHAPQPPVSEQFTQPSRVLTIGLGAALATPQRARLDGLGQMRHRRGGGQRIADEQPARAGLHCDVDRAAIEALGPARDRRRCGVDPAAEHLARLGVQRIESDLRSVHVKPGYDRHRGLLYSSGIATLRESLALSGGGPGSCHL